MKKSLVYSLLIHIFVIALAYFYIRHLPLEITVTNHYTEVEVVIANRTSAPAQTKKMTESTKLKPPGNNILSLGNLGLKPKVLDEDHDLHRESSKRQHSNSGGTSAGSDGFEIANGMDLIQESKLYPFIKALWQRINAAVGYPDDFVKKRIAGTVTVQLSVDQRGVFSGSFLHATSDEMLLKTYVLVMLAYVLKNPLPEKTWADQKKMTIVTQFDFSVFTVGHAPTEQSLMHQKNVLYFKREAWATPKVYDVIEKFYTKYIPPIIPIPGGFYIDFYRAYQLVQSMGKLDEDDLRNVRLEQMKEQWDQLIQKRGW